MGTMNERWFITYDIADPKRLRRVANALLDHGTRLQNSVFDCNLTDQQLTGLQGRLARLIDHAEDSVRYVPLCERDWRGRQCQGTAAAASSGLPDHWVV